MSDAERYYGIWDGNHWMVDRDNEPIYHRSRAIMGVKLDTIRNSDGRHVGNDKLRVAAIPEHGGKPDEE